MAKADELAAKLHRQWEYDGKNGEKNEFTDLERIVNNIPPPAEEVRRFVELQEAFTPFRSILGYFSHHKEQAPTSQQSYLEAVAVNDLIEEKENALARHFEDEIRAYRSLPHPGLTDKAETAGRLRFESAKELLLIYEPGSRERTEEIEREVDERLGDLRLQETRRRKVNIPRAETKRSEAYMQLRSKFEEERAKLDKDEYRPAVPGARKRLKPVVERLNDYANEAASNSYDFADEINRAHVVAATRYRESVTSDQAKFWKRAGMGATAALVSIGMTLGAIKYVAFNDLQERVTATEAVSAGVSATSSGGSLEANAPHETRLTAVEERQKLYDKNQARLTTEQERLAAVQAASERRIDHVVQEQEKTKAFFVSIQKPQERSTSPIRVTARETARQESGGESAQTIDYPIYIVKRGDTLTGIRSRLYGDTNWQALVSANPGLLDDPQAWCYPGQPIVLPESGLRRTAEVWTFPLTPFFQSEYNRRGMLPVRLFQAPKEMSYADISLTVTGSPNYTDEIKAAYGGVNRSLGEIRKGDYIHIPHNVPVDSGTLIRGRT